MSRNKVGCTNGSRGRSWWPWSAANAKGKMHYQTRFLATKHVNAFAAGALLQTTFWELTALSRPLAGFGKV